MYYYNHRRILTALGFVNGQRVGQLQLIKLTQIVDHLSLVEANPQHLTLNVYGCYPTDVPIIDQFVVVVDRLQNSVASAEHSLPALHLCPGRLRRIQPLLQGSVKLTDADRPTMQRRNNLDIVRGEVELR